MTRMNIIRDYLLIEIKPENDQKTMSFLDNIESVKNIKEYTHQFHGTKQVLIGEKK